MPRLPLLLALALAGCMGLPPNPPSPGDTAPSSFAETDCINHEIVVPVDPSVLAPYLPEGYVAEELAAGQPGLIALAYACEGPQPHTVGMVVIPLTGMPEDRRDPDADVHGMLLHLVVAEGDMLFAPLHAWGAGVALVNGTATVDVPAETPDGAPRAGRASVTGDGASFAIDTAIRPLNAADDGNSVRFFVLADDGSVVSVDLDLTESHRAALGGASLDASGWAPLPEGRTAGLGFHEAAGLFTWSRVS